jgi:membrane protease YdiL (CAAX protease family)
LPSQLTTILVSAAIMIALWVYFGIWAWAIRFILQGRLLRPDRSPPVPWNGWQLLVLVFLIVLFWPLVVGQAMRSAGLLVERSRNTTAPVVVPPADSTHTDEEKPIKTVQRLREDLVLNACLYPFWIGSILGLLWLTSGAKPEQMGLTTRGWPRHVLYGFLAWVLFAPPVFIFNGVINLIFRFVLRAKEEQHPLTRLLGLESSSADAVLIVLTAALAAPFFEELLFRGVLQPWFAKRRWAGLIGIAGAFIFAVLDRGSEIVQGLRTRDWLVLAQGAGAPLFVLVMVPGYFLVCYLADLLLLRGQRSPSFPLWGKEVWGEGESLAFSAQPLSASPPLCESGIVGEGESQAFSPQPLSPPLGATGDQNAESVTQDRFPSRLQAVRWTGAIYASSLLFAAAHSSVWPSPIALFVLALVLGYLAYRTRSLVSSIMLHGLFNGVSCVVLLLMPHPEKGNPVTTAVPLTAPVSNSSTVPGS